MPNPPLLRLPLVLVTGLLLAAQGCNLTLPTGLTGTGGTTGAKGTEDCKSLFFKLDLDGDRVLTQDEFIKARLAMQAPAPAKPVPAKDSTTKALQATADAAATASATVAVPPVDDKLLADLQAAFKAMDKDGNGKVTADEFMATCDPSKPGPMPPVDNKPPVDPNGRPTDGKLVPGPDGQPPTSVDGKPPIGPDGKPPIMPPDDRRVPPGLDCGSQFKQMDLNQDGGIDYKEWLSFYNRPTSVDARPIPEADLKLKFTGLDRNGDGRIDLTEYCGQITPPPPADDCKGRFLKLDRDQSGSISFDEYFGGMGAQPEAKEKYYAEFKGLDRNGDGQLTPDELCGQVTPPMPPVPGPATCKDNFYQADTDKNGVVSWEEFYAQALRNIDKPAPSFKDTVYAEFKGKDRDGNGSLTFDEACQGQPTTQPPTTQPPANTACDGDFVAFDANRDKQVSIEEYVNGKWGQLRFIKAPTPEEEASARANFKAMAVKLDVNQDGQLSIDEFRRGCGS
ncbi:MAG: calcium-binding protein LPS1-beta-like [Cyanobacteria bacterium RYN_339]|nr:calcium-binding protein LPS1-beta-like [Cyanobacteria bacterium RYN_339]